MRFNQIFDLICKKYSREYLLSIQLIGRTVASHEHRRSTRVRARMHARYN